MPQSKNKHNQFYNVLEHDWYTLIICADGETRAFHAHNNTNFKNSNTRSHYLSRQFHLTPCLTRDKKCVMGYIFCFDIFSFSIKLHTVCIFCFDLITLCSYYLLTYIADWQLIIICYMRADNIVLNSIYK